MTEYRQALVAFIDILGFRSLVMDEFKDKAEEISDLLSEFNKLGGYGTLDYPSKKIEGVVAPKRVISPSHCISFSDSVIRITYLPEELSDLEFKPCWENMSAEDLPLNILESFINSEVEVLSSVQRALMLKGVFLRGGLTLGMIHYDTDKNTLFGPAMIRAYDLETIARVPRIIIDPDLSYDRRWIFHKLMNRGLVITDDEGFTNISYLGQEKFLPLTYYHKGIFESVDRFLQIGQREGLRFPIIESLRLTDRSIFDSPKYEIQRLEKQRYILLDQLNRNVNNQNVFAKYMWVANKHNESLYNIIECLKYQQGKEAVPIHKLLSNKIHYYEIPTGLNWEYELDQWD